MGELDSEDRLYLSYLFVRILCCTSVPFFAPVNCLYTLLYTGYRLLKFTVAVFNFSFPSL